METLHCLCTSKIFFYLVLVSLFIVCDLVRIRLEEIVIEEGCGIEEKGLEGKKYFTDNRILKAVIRSNFEIFPLIFLKISKSYIFKSNNHNG